MPKICSDYVQWIDNSGEREGRKVDIHVNADGLFYIPIDRSSDDELEALFKWCRSEEHRLGYQARPNNRVWVTCDTKAGLKTAYSEFLAQFHRYTVTEEPVILYVIGSRTRYATNDAGEIARNSAKAGFQWAEEDKRFDDPFSRFHDNRNQSDHGFMVMAGAKAMMKKTLVRGEFVKEEYDLWYGPGNDHCEDEHPAGRLNKWLYSLPEDAEEMPYTDEAAEFFDHLIMSMVKMASRVREATDTQEKLLNLIKTGVSLIGGNNSER